MTDYWQDFALLGAFLFVLGLIWTFKSSFQKFSYLLTSQAGGDQGSDQRYFHRLWLEGVVCCVCAITMVTTYGLSVYSRDNFETSDEDSRSFLLLLWLPFFMFGAVACSAEAISPMYKILVKPFLMVAFLCEFALVTHHVQNMPVGSDKTMYTPMYLLIYFSAIVVLAEIVIPDMEDLLVLRCGVTLVKGTWYAQVAFTLCMTGREWVRDEGVGITVLLVFLWHVVLSWIVIRVMQNTIKAVLLDQPWLYDEYDDEQEEMSTTAVKGKRKLVGQKEPLHLTKQQLIEMNWSGSAAYLK